jgi:phenylacetate-CoA ligase
MTKVSKASLRGFASDAAAGLIRKVIHPLWTKHAHPAYARYLREFELNQYLHPEQFRSLQMRRLRQQLVDAFRYVPFYRHRMTQAGLTPLDIQTHDDLSLLPVVTKRDIQDHQDMLLASNIPETKRERHQTGASTGSPLQFYLDLERADSRMASTHRHNGWAGLRPGDWYAWLEESGLDVCATRDPSWRQKLLDRSLNLHTAAVSEESMAKYAEVLRKYRPRYMVADAQSAMLFAGFCLANNIRDIAFESVIVGAHTLLPGERHIVEQAFGGKVFSRYSCQAVSVIASECEYHSGLHINADALLVEVEAVPDLPTGMGRVLVTDLFNRSMPLIRYETGDMARLDSDMQCPCGRSLPLIGNVQRRNPDSLRSTNGRTIAGPSLALLAADMRDVRQVQFIQADPKHVTLKVVAGRGYGPLTEQELRRRMLPYLENPGSLTIVTADSIPSEPSGNYRTVKQGDEPIAINRAVR